MVGLDVLNRRFDQLLHFRGMKRVLIPVNRVPSNLDLENPMESSSDSEADSYSSTGELYFHEDHIPIVEALNIGDADNFYEIANETDEDENYRKMIASDKNFTFVTNNSPLNEQFKQNIDRQFSSLSQCSQWDFGNKLQDDETYSPDLSSQVDNYGPIIRSSAEVNLHDRLVLRYIDKSRLLHLNSIRKFKNNLTCVITCDTVDYLVVAENSELLLFQFNNETMLPMKFANLSFDTRPTFTFTTDRLVSTWPRFPHTINFVKSFDNFCGQQILASCSDDGSLKIWYTSTLIRNLKKLNMDKLNSDVEADSEYRPNLFSGLKIEPDFKLKVEASLWGLDFLTYNDEYGCVHTLILASDNSQSVFLFYYHQVDKQFYHVKTHPILNNIPEVSFISHEIIDNVHSIKASCACISEELITFKFKFQINLGPLDEFQTKMRNCTYYVDAQMELFENNELNETPGLLATTYKFQRVQFPTPTIVARIILGDDGWTTKTVNSKYFKPVSSIGEVFGDVTINESQEVAKITKESIILNLLYNPVESSNLGLASYFQYYDCKTMKLGTKSDTHNYNLSNSDDEYRRIHKGLFKFERTINSNEDMYRLKEEPNVDFVIISTAKKIALLQLETLYCNCSTGELFDMEIPYNNETKHCSRISISAVIPELLSLIAVCQLGLVSILRLCQCRGVYGFRQEHIFPNAVSLAICDSGYRTIVGLAVRNRSIGSFKRFLLYLSYSDGLVLTYELSMNQINSSSII